MKAQTLNSYRIQFLALILAGLIVQPARAEVIPGRWEKVSALDLGTPITLELKNGDQVEGTFEGLSESEVDVETHTARAIIPKANIQTITTRPKDPLSDGAAIGATIGVVTTRILGLMALNGGGSGDAIFLGPLLLFGGIAVGTGAALGAAADAATKIGDIVLYEAPGTPLSPQHQDSEGRPR